MKLISMTDFVLERAKISILPLTIEETFKEGAKITNEIFNYANFLKQPLKLEMFIPCDEDGIPMEKPKISCATCEKCTCSPNYIKLYDEAKEKVFFEGIDLDTAKFHCERNDRTIEYFTSFNIELTPNAIKQIGL